MKQPTPGTWNASVLTAMQQLDGDLKYVHLSRLYERLVYLRAEEGLSLSANFRAIVRRCLQDLQATRPSGRRDGLWILPLDEVSRD